jgi:integrase
MRRKTDYLFLRPGSRNWHIRLQAPGKRTEKSLGTPDRVQAELLALPLIAEHKAALLAARPRLEAAWVPKYPPGLHVGPDGERLFATEREVHHLDADGAVIRCEPNGGPGHRILNLPLGAVIHFGNPTRPINELRRLGPVFDLTKMDRPKVPTKNADDAIFETYLQHANVIGYYEREARAAWALFKSLCDKPLKHATRDDGRKVVQHFEAQGLKSASIRKKIGWLNAAVNLAIKEGRLTFNPFSSIVPKRDDEEKRLPLDDADMRNVKRNFGRLDKSEQLLFRLLAATGMRLSEAFEINNELKERGVRYVVIGHKTEQSKRRVPLPAGVLPYLPPTIMGPLFHHGSRSASKRLNRFLNDCGIVDPRKVIHSLRHRAQDRLRAAGCPTDVRYELLGHERKTVAAGYGVGHPMPLLKKWIDKIGF